MARRRELRVVATEQVRGAVIITDDGNPVFEGSASRVLESFRRRLGDAKAAAVLLDEGWSNGYLYLAPET
jgi:hypothetical protein